MQTTIYALVDPRAPTVFRYIGRTNRPAFRHLQHCSMGWGQSAKEQWVEDLRADGILPQFVTLEVVAPEIEQERERYWIHSQPAGQLVNTKDPKRSNRRGTPKAAEDVPVVRRSGAFQIQTATLQRELVESALIASHGNITEAAKTLGVSRPTLYEKIALLGIKRFWL